jgi:hypothetical protein
MPSRPLFPVLRFALRNGDALAAGFPFTRAAGRKIEPQDRTIPQIKTSVYMLFPRASRFPFLTPCFLLLDSCSSLLAPAPEFQSKVHFPVFCFNFLSLDLVEPFFNLNPN